MQREVFILPDGEAFFVWDIRFSAATQHTETHPCNYHQEDGSFRTGVVYETIESSEVSFRTYVGSVRNEMQGQLSSPNDVFHEVTILSLKPADADDQMLVGGKATRIIKIEFADDALPTHPNRRSSG